MPALAQGSKAPQFTLPAVDGSSISLQHALRRGPVVLAFFKITCPTCQYTFPFLERLSLAYAREKVSLVGISQDPREGTLLFMREYGITFPVLLDDPSAYAVSNAYGLTHVPTVFFVTSAGIEFSSVGWFRPEFEELNTRLARAAGMPPAAVFAPGEDVLHSKGG